MKVLRRVVLIASGLAWSAAAAQTPMVPAHPAPHAVHKKVPVVVKKVPVVVPHRAGPPRHAVHSHAAHVAKPPEPKPEMAQPVPKPPPAPKKPPVPANQGTNTGLPLPRYAALKTDDANMRSGPGERYPVIWQYQRRDLPVKIEREFDVWRLVEDMDGVKGWVHQATLAGHRTFVVTGTDDRTMRAEASDTAEAVAVLKPGVVGRVRACDVAAAWCQVQVGDYRGWLKRGDVWGVEAGEAVAP